MALIAKLLAADPGKQKMSREQLIGLIQSDAKFMDEREDITDYIRTLKAGEGLDEDAIRAGYQQLQGREEGQGTRRHRCKHGLTTGRPASLRRRHPPAHDLRRRAAHRPDGAARPGLAERREKELALMADLVPLLNKRAHGRDISGLSAYEHGGAR